MRRAAEFLAFLGLAVCLHLAVLLGVESAAAPSTGTAGPTMTAVIGGASAEVTALVEIWETQPETGTPTEIRTEEPIGEALPLAARTEPETATMIARLATELPIPLSVPPLSALATLPLPAERVTPDRAPDPVEPPEDILDTQRDPVVAPPMAMKPPAKPVTAVHLARPAPGSEPTNSAATRPEPTRTNLAPSGASAGIPHAGLTESGEVSSPTEAEIKSLQQTYGAQVRAAIEREKRYPNRARLRRTEGVARLQVTIDRRGRLVLASIASSSGATSLDEAALSAVNAIQQYPIPPLQLRGDRFSFVIAMAFRLR